MVKRNIRSLAEIRQQHTEAKSWSDRLSDSVTRFAGSMLAVWLHAVYFGGWVVINLGWVPGLKPFDPFPFVMLAMAASVEAIFLSTFVLVSQNRAALLAERRAELNLQIDLLSEHEITRLISLVDAIANHLGVKRDDQHDVEELKQDVNPERVAAAIESVEREIEGNDARD